MVKNMKLSLNASSIRSALLFSIVFAYLYSYASTIGLSSTNDDHVFLSVFKNGTVLDFINNNYHTWSGRTAIEFLMVSTIGYSLFWKLGIPLSIVLLAYSSCRISTCSKSATYISIFVLLFSLIPGAINGDAAWWVTGFYNYLLPASVAVYIFSVLFKGDSGYFVKTLCIPLAIYVSYMEQVTLCLIVCSAIILAFMPSTRSRYFYLLLSLISVNFAICISAPGNINRLHLETANWMPLFDHFTLTQKVSLGFDKAYQFITFKYNYPLLIVSLLTVLIRLKRQIVTHRVFVMLIVVSSFIPLMVYHSLCGSLFFEGNIIDNGNASRLVIYFNYAYCIALVVSLLFLIIDMMFDKVMSGLPLAGILCGFMSIVIMGFSPTVYASGVRVYFVFEILLIITSMYMLKRLKELNDQ
ncbi:Uncharacterised protein [Enterobacter asburiae]|nr:Uncharacterised protein [Enterobacter asburiae]SAB23017.1 Uncharacterised protein [Enterobacter asburiae]SAF91533.1 Uncharacterised protein [Enterobacter cloacae]